MMRCKRIAWLCILIVCFCVVGVVAFSPETKARMTASCKEMAKSGIVDGEGFWYGNESWHYGYGDYYEYANSAWYACKGYFQIDGDGTPRGSLWIGDTWDSRDGYFGGSPISKDIDSRVSVTVDDLNRGKKEITLHGAWFGSTSDVAATYIKIIKANRTIRDNEYEDYIEYSPIGNVPESMIRFGQVSMWTNKVVSYVRALQLDIGEFLAGELRDGNCRTDGGNTECGLRLEIYRCPSGSTPESSNGNCYSDAAFVNVEIKNNIAGKVAMLGTSNDQSGTSYGKTRSDWERWYYQPQQWREDTNWSDNNGFNNEVTKEIDDCDSGCYTQFGHYLWSQAIHNGEGTYRIKKEVWNGEQLIESSYLNSSNGSYSIATFHDAWDSSFESEQFYFIKRDSVKLLPGQKVCETLEFYVDSKGTQSAKACVRANGELAGETGALIGTDDVSVKWNAWKAKGNDAWVATNNDSVSSTSRLESKDIECNSVGCKIQFRHYLQDGSGNGGAYYRIMRKVNSDKSSCWVSATGSKKDKFCSGSVACSNEVCTNDADASYNIHYNNEANITVDRLGNGYISMKGNDLQWLQSDPMTIYPGQTVCERLYFSSSPISDIDSTTYTDVCVTATGTVQTDIKVDVKNESVSKYNNYASDYVYAKPRDRIAYRIVYYPIPQYTSDLLVRSIVTNDGNSGVLSENKTVKELFNTYYNGGNNFNWNNAYWFGNSNSGYLNLKGSRKLEIGDNSPDTKELYIDSVADTTTRELIETAMVDPIKFEEGQKEGETCTVLHSEGDESVWSTPKTVKFERDDTSQNKIRALVSSKNCYHLKDDATVRVPYNFENKVDIEDVDEGVFYAGQNGSVSYIPKVSPKRNNETDGTYATIVENPKVKACVHLENNSECLNKDSGPQEPIGGKKAVWNAGSNADGSTETPKTINFSVPDYPAGTELCVDVSVYPANSGADTNWSDAEGSHTWSEPARKCFQIAKRPSFQVWGGSVSAKSISAPVAEKMNLGGYSFDKAAVFGSWAELAVVTNIKKDDGMENTTNKKAMASGAGLGYDSQINGKLWPDPSPSEDEGLGNNPKKADASSYEKPGGGMRNIDYTNLTFNGGGGVIVPTLAKVKSALGINETAVEEGHTLSRREDITETTLFYDTNTIEITGEIMVKRGTYSSLESVPKVVIYSDGGINIECSVRRIDAILIAIGDINTCSNPGSEGNIKKAANAQEQLTINGAIIVGKKSSDENGERTLLLNRTYGAATGNNSIVPAEIINYDNSMMFIGGGSASAGASVDPSKLEVQHIRELAPRY